MDQDEFDFIMEDLRARVKSLVKQIGTEVGINKNHDINRYLEKVKSRLKLGYLHFNILSLSIEEKDIVSDSFYISVRKNLNITLSLLGDLVGKKSYDFLTQSNSYKVKLYKSMSLLKVADYFKLIGLQIDRLNEMLSYSSKLKSSVIELKEKFCLIFLNAIDFKLLIRSMEVTNDDYDKYAKIMKLVKLNVEETAEQYWNLHMKDPRYKESTLEIKKSIQLLEILNKVNLIINDADEKERVTKKISSLGNYQKRLVEESSRRR